MANKSSLIDILGKLQIFKGAAPEMIVQLAECTVIDNYPDKCEIIRKGEDGDTLYLILEGTVRILDGEHELAQLGGGQFFGELSILDNEPRSSTVTAKGPVVAGSLSRNDFYNVLYQFPDVTKTIMEALSKRLRGQNQSLINHLRSREEELQTLVRLRTEELSVALENLKLSQEQLIRTEKLASLGQLSAGIAHEIQNPLNFVNNFSQLSEDLLIEMNETSDPDIIKELNQDLIGNIQRIKMHGKRASTIIRGMLDYSNVATKEKTPSDFNQISRESLANAYKEFRSTWPGFSCNFEEEYDPAIPVLNLVPQDISRVLLNLLNNAFYAIHEKKKNSTSTYNPSLNIKTAHSNSHVSCYIVDNGNGIPGAIKEKIFEPFFTTKPTGVGVGLGLSISYNIIKAYSGELKINSRENEFTSIEVILPVS